MTCLALTGRSTVARVVSPDATAQQCQNRYQRSLDPTLKRGPWSPAEDVKLHLAVSAYGNSWVDVAAMMEGRSNEQCRDRWNERLDPKINREVWTEEEDMMLMDAVKELGEGKWKAVSEKMGNGRKDSAVSYQCVVRLETSNTDPCEQCRARYETLKKGKARASADKDHSLKPPDDERDESREPSEPTRPIPRKRASNKGKGKQPVAPLPAEDSTQVDANSTRPLQKRPRGRPRKVTQAQEETLTMPGDGGSNPERVERPAPRKRGRPSKVKPHESPATTDGLEVEDEQNAQV